MNKTKLRNYVYGYTNYIICGMKVLALKMASGMQKDPNHY